MLLDELTADLTQPNGFRCSRFPGSHGMQQIIVAAEHRVRMVDDYDIGRRLWTDR